MTRVHFVTGQWDKHLRSSSLAELLERSLKAECGTLDKAGPFTGFKMVMRSVWVNMRALGDSFHEDTAENFSDEELEDHDIEEPTGEDHDMAPDEDEDDMALDEDHDTMDKDDETALDEDDAPLDADNDADAHPTIMPPSLVDFHKNENREDILAAAAVVLVALGIDFRLVWEDAQGSGVQTMCRVLDIVSVLACYAVTK